MTNLSQLYDNLASFNSKHCHCRGHLSSGERSLDGPCETAGTKEREEILEICVSWKLYTNKPGRISS